MTSTSKGFTYTPALPAIARFHADDQSFMRLLVGAVGQSKTTSALAEILHRAVRQEPGPDGIRRARWAVTRASFSQLKTTVLESWRALVGGDAAGRIIVGGSPIVHDLKFGDVELTVWFLPCSDDADIERLLSLELTGLVVSEWTTAPETVVRMGAARVGRYPSAVAGGVLPTWSGIICEGHAAEPDTWQSRLVDEAKTAPTKNGMTLYRLPSAMVKEGGHWKENPAGINPHLPEGYYSRLALGQSDDWLARFVGNQRVYTQVGRAVYAGVYSDGIHTLPQEYDPPSGSALVIGLDPDLFGSAVLMQFLPNGRVVAVDEVFNEEAGITALSRALVGLVTQRYPGCIVTRVWTDPSANFRGVDTQTALDLLRKNTPWRCDPVSTNDPTMRQEVVSHLLRTLVEGKPMLLVSPRCKVLRAALSGRYRFKELKSAGSTVAGEIVKDENATVAESLQYGLLGGGMGAYVRGRLQPNGRPWNEPRGVYVAEGSMAAEANNREGRGFWLND